MNVPFFRPAISDAEIGEVIASLKSGWITVNTAQRVEEEFKAAVRGEHPVAVNSCTAALHLAVARVIGLRPGMAVLVPTMTFAATTEMVRYQGDAILVDCDPITFNMNLLDAEQKLADLRTGRLPDTIPQDTPVVGIIPVHVSGLMMDMAAVNEFAKRHDLWVVEDAAMRFPPRGDPMQTVRGSNAERTLRQFACYSFYANKTITTGEGGMATNKCRPR
ncbi:MAG: DegT/DnrJ/EryC1/StrS aminotransferase family protein [Paludibaculum sp.]